MLAKHKKMAISKGDQFFERDLKAKRVGNILKGERVGNIFAFCFFCVHCVCCLILLSSFNFLSFVSSPSSYPFFPRLVSSFLLGVLFSVSPHLHLVSFSSRAASRNSCVFCFFPLIFTFFSSVGFKFPLGILLLGFPSSSHCFFFPFVLLIRTRVTVSTSNYSFLSSISSPSSLPFCSSSLFWSFQASFNLSYLFLLYPALFSFTYFFFFCY